MHVLLLICSRQLRSTSQLEGCEAVSAWSAIRTWGIWPIVLWILASWSRKKRPTSAFCWTRGVGQRPRQWHVSPTQGPQTVDQEQSCWPGLWGMSFQYTCCTSEFKLQSTFHHVCLKLFCKAQLVHMWACSWKVNCYDWLDSCSRDMYASRCMQRRSCSRWKDNKPCRTWAFEVSACTLLHANLFLMLSCVAPNRIQKFGWRHSPSHRSTTMRRAMQQLSFAGAGRRK